MVGRSRDDGVQRGLEDSLSRGYDADTGCIGWPETAWPAFEERLAKPASEQGYYVQEVETGEFLGHVHYEVDSEGAAHIGLNVIPGRRGNGLGQLFLRLLLERVWADTLAQVAVNDFEDDRLDVLRLHQRCGFIADPTTTTAFGRPTRTWRLRREDAR